MKKLYHGSYQQFTQFRGMYVYATEDIELARMYGDHIAVIEKDSDFEFAPGHPEESPTFISYYPQCVNIIKWIE